MPVVIGLLIALGIFPWMILLVHMYVYHWRKQVDGVKLYEKARADHLDFNAREARRQACEQALHDPRCEP